MTSTTIERPARPLAGTTGRNLDVRRYLLAAAMVASAVLFVAAQGLFLHLGKSATAAIAGVAPHRGRQLASVYCDMLGSAGFIAIAAGAMRLLRSGRGATWVTVGGVFLTIGGLSNALGGAVFGYLLYFGTAHGVTPTQGAALTNAANHASAVAAAPISFAAVGVFAVGLLCIAIGLIRSAAVPKWLAIGFLVSSLLLAAAGVGPLALGIGAPFVVAVTLLAGQVARSA